MSKLYAVAGSKIYIGPKVASADAVVLADFTGVTWTEVKGWTNAGSLGDTRELITQNLIDISRTRKAKGTANAGSMENTFVPLINDPGQIKMKAAEGVCGPSMIKIEWGAGCVDESVVTVTIASPGVVTWPDGHGLEAGASIVFATDGDLPSGLTAGTTYYVLTSGLTATTFQLAATPGGTAIVTTGTQSGVHTATSQPAGQTDYFYSLVMPGSKSGGEANTPQTRAWTLEIDSNIIEV